MNISKKQGFTLIELIVVMVIVAVLAAAAVPLYNQYVDKSQSNTADNIASSLNQAGGACMADEGTFTPSTGICTGNNSGGGNVTIPTGFTAAGVGTSINPIVVTHTASGNTSGTYSYQ